VIAGAAAAGIFLTLAGSGRGAGVTPTGTPADDGLVASISGGMSNDLVSVTIGDAPSDVSVDPDQKWLYVTHKAGQSPAQDALDAWYTSLIVGAYGAECQAQATHCIAGYSFTGSGGPQQDDSEVAVGVQSEPLTSSSMQDVANTIDTRLGQVGLQASSISFKHPYGLAPVVDIQSNDPQRAISALKAGQVFAGLDLDGAFVQMEDTSGKVFYAVGFSSRAQEARGWVQPGVSIANSPSAAP